MHTPALTLALALAGLMTTACASGAAAPHRGVCNAAPAQFAVGQPYSADLAEHARVAAGARIVRRIEPGMAYTLEYSDARLNLETDVRAVVTLVRCG